MAGQKKSVLIFAGFTGVWRQWSDASERVKGQGAAVLRTHPCRMPPPSGAKLLGQPDPRPLQMGFKWALSEPVEPSIVILRWTRRFGASGRTSAA